MIVLSSLRPTAAAERWRWFFAAPCCWCWWPGKKKWRELWVTTAAVEAVTTFAPPAAVVIRNLTATIQRK